MSDAQYLEWIARNLISFRPNSANTSTIVTIGPCGTERTYNYAHCSPNPSMVDLLKGTIDSVRFARVGSRAQSSDNREERHRPIVHGHEIFG